MSNLFLSLNYLFDDQTRKDFYQRLRTNFTTSTFYHSLLHLLLVVYIAQELSISTTKFNTAISIAWWSHGHTRSTGSRSTCNLLYTFHSSTTTLFSDFAVSNFVETINRPPQMTNMALTGDHTNKSQPHGFHLNYGQYIPTRIYFYSSFPYWGLTSSPCCWAIKLVQRISLKPEATRQTKAGQSARSWSPRTSSLIQPAPER